MINLPFVAWGSYTVVFPYHTSFFLFLAVFFFSVCYIAISVTDSSKLSSLFAYSSSPWIVIWAQAAMMTKSSSSFLFFKPLSLYDLSNIRNCGFFNNFLALRSIYLSSTLVHFKNGPEYLTALFFFFWFFFSIYLMRFQLQNLVSKTFSFFLILFSYSFLFYEFVVIFLFPSD